MPLRKETLVANARLVKVSTEGSCIQIGGEQQESPQCSLIFSLEFIERRLKVLLIALEPVDADRIWNSKHAGDVEEPPDPIISLLNDYNRGNC